MLMLRELLSLANQYGTFITLALAVGLAWAGLGGALFEQMIFKDGKLWSLVNVDDELGFAVMDFKF